MQTNYTRTLDQDLKGISLSGHVEKSILGRRKSMSKGPVVGVCPGHLCHSRLASGCSRVRGADEIRR